MLKSMKWLNKNEQESQWNDPICEQLTAVVFLNV